MLQSKYKASPLPTVVHSKNFDPGKIWGDCLNSNYNHRMLLIDAEGAENKILNYLDGYENKDR